MTRQGLLTAKARLSKKNLSIPRLELVAMHMAANLCLNIKEAFHDKYEINFYGWTDSTVALHWVTGKGNYKQFVHNRANKIREKDFIKWRYVPTEKNPADLASRGCFPEKLNDDWIIGPNWL